MSYRKDCKEEAKLLRKKWNIAKYKLSDLELFIYEKSTDKYLEKIINKSSIPFIEKYNARQYSIDQVIEFKENESWCSPYSKDHQDWIKEFRLTNSYNKLMGAYK